MSKVFVWFRLKRTENGGCPRFFPDFFHVQEGSETEVQGATLRSRLSYITETYVVVRVFAACRGRKGGGGKGIRTLGGVNLNGFQDRRLRPLGHPSRRAREEPGRHFTPILKELCGSYRRRFLYRRKRCSPLRTAACAEPDSRPRFLSGNVLAF